VIMTEVLMKYTLAGLIILAAAATADDWFRIVIECEQQAHQLDQADRRFLRMMINQLTAHDEAVYPSSMQQRWLLDIKRRLDHKRLDHKL
jgi:hypothetical protein